MSLDVEALLDSAAASAAKNGHTTSTETAATESSRDQRSSRNDRDDRHRHERSERRDRDRHRDRDGNRDLDRGRDRKRRDERGMNSGGDVEMTSPRSERGSAHGSHRSSRRRSRSRDSEHHRDRASRRDRYRDSADPDDSFRSSGGGGDFYRGGRRPRSRSRSPGRDRYYRPEGGPRRERGDFDRHPRDRDRERDGRGGHREGGRRRSPSPKSAGKGGKSSKSPEPQLTEDERDRRTVFVQQLAARLRTKELIAFFEKVGPVKEAQIVKDRVSGRSKGVGYVEFKQEDSVPLAIQLTGQKLLGIPIIAQLTEAEKNRQARTGESGTHGNTNSVPFHRLYVGNIHFSITESDLQNVFEPFGELEFVQLQKEEQGRSRGYGFVQFRDPNQAREALEKMNGFELAGRPIRVGLGNDKFTPESTANLLQRFHGQNSGHQNYPGSAFSGHGGRGSHAGGAGGNFDRAGTANDKGAGGASALDDTDVAGVNFNNYSRDALMRKLARTDDESTNTADRSNESNNLRGRNGRPSVAEVSRQTSMTTNMPSRCVVLRNMFDPSQEEGDSWVKELEDDVRAECEEKYGHVVHISLDPNTQGDIYLKFDRIQGGENAIRGLNGRFFGGRQISAQPVVDAVYSSLFSGTASL